MYVSVDHVFEDEEGLLFLLEALFGSVSGTEYMHDWVLEHKYYQ